MDSTATWVFRRARWLGFRLYYRLVAANYDHQWRSTDTRTAAGRFRSYELIDRHTDDRMLAEIDDHCHPAAVIYDLGANVGIYSLALAASSPQRRLVACEPAPRTRRQLQRNVDCNEFASRITVLDCGVGDEDSSQRFYLSTYPELSGFDRESASRWEATVADTVPVPVRRVDTLTASHPAPDAIKIDVEGAAPAVLRGATETLRHHQPTLFIELHTEALSTDSTQEIREILERVDYTITERNEYWRCDPPADGHT